MKRRTLSAIAFIMSLCMLCGIFGSCGEIEYAVVSENNQSSDGFYYTLYENGDAVITGGEVPENGQLVIPATVDGHKVIAVGESAFEGNEGFYSLVISSNLKYIGDFAFSGCTYLAYADLGGTEKICNSGFYDNRNLTSIRGLDGLKEIGSNAFGYCLSLCDFTLPDTLTTIDDDAFNCCSALNGITLPASVTSMGTGVFSDCSVLTYADVSALTSIPDKTFRKCENLTTVVFSTKLKSVGSEAFRGCTSLMTLTLPKSLKTVSESAFASCSALTELNFTGSEGAWNKISFGDANDEILALRPYCSYKISNAKATENEYTYVARTAAENSEGTEGSFTFQLHTDGTACITGYTGVAAALTIPETAGGYKVTGIESGAFAENTVLTEVTIPDSVDTIGEAAFYECTKLAKVNGGNNVIELGTNAFYDTQWLSDQCVKSDYVIFGDGVLVTYSGSLNTVTVPDEVKHIGGGAFVSNPGVKCVICGAGVCSVSSQAFSFCEGLIYFYAPALKYIGEYAFCGCSAITCFKFSDTVTSIGGSIFTDCYELRSVCLGNSIGELSTLAFDYCQNLRTVCVPKSMTKLSSACFDSAISVIFLYPGTEAEFRSICNENSPTRYLSDDMLITGVPEK